MGFGMLVTGLAIYKPTQLHLLTTILGGYEMARWEHFWITIGFVGFFVIHVLQVILAGWNNFRSMVSGREIKKVEDVSLEGGEEVVVIPEPNQKKPSNPEEAPKQEMAESKPHDPPEEKPDGLSQAVGDSAKIEQVPDGESFATDQAEGASQTGTVPEGEALMIASSGQHVKQKPTIEEPPTERSGPTVAEGNAAVLSDSRRHTRRSFVVAAAAAAAGYGAYHWLDHLPEEEMQPATYRQAFDANAAISRAVSDDRGLAPTYPLSKAQDLRVNGVYGLKQMLEPASYRLQLVGSTSPVSDPRYSRDVTAWTYVYVDEKTKEDQGHDTKTPPASANTAEKMAPASMLEQAKEQQNRTKRMPRGKEEAGESRSTLPVGTPWAAPDYERHPQVAAI